MEAVRLDAWRPAFASEWGPMQPESGPLGGLRLSEQVIRRVKQPPSGIAGAVQQTVGTLLGLALALLGIPLFVFGLVWLGSRSLLWLPVFLLAWLVGVVWLLMRAMRPSRASSPYGRAMVRLADLAYCPDCDVIFNTETGRVVPLDALSRELYVADSTHGDDHPPSH
jgi:hypothetical protein